MSHSHESSATDSLKAQITVMEQLLTVFEEAVRKQCDHLEQEKAELVKANRIMMGREERILEVKREVNELLKELNRPPRHNV